MAGMTSPRFRSEVYHGTAGYYDSFRLAYPAGLIDDLRRELLACEPDGRFRQDATFACDLARRPA